MAKAFSRATVAGRKNVTDNLMVITLQPHASFAFVPGQYVTLVRDGVKKPYSIASAPHEGVLELFIELVPNGALTPKLWKLEPGDTIDMLFGRGKGDFLYEPARRNQVMVSTVTGIAPYVSMIRACGLSAGHKFFIFHGASFQDEFGYDAELSHTRGVTYIPTVSRPDDPRNAAWQGETKRVNERVEDFFVRCNLKPEDSMVYACGNSGMIADVKARLEPKSWNVKAEKFF